MNDNKVMAQVSNLYIVDFAKNLIHRKNLFAIVYLLLNVVIITMFFNYILEDRTVSFIYGFVSYIITTCIALSPFGEWIFRFMHGCKKITDNKLLARLEPIFFEVKEKATKKHTDFHIDADINLYISDDSAINAFALGRRTVVVTKGLLELTDEEIKAVLGHEFGHLATHDTDLGLLITVGNFIISAVVTIIKLMITIYYMVASIITSFIGGTEGLLATIATAIYHLCISVFVNGAMWVWTQLGVLLVMKSSRDAEYEADAFSCDLGYSKGLLSFFHKLMNLESGNNSDNSVFAALSSSHPETEKRIARIERFTNHTSI